MQDVRPFRGLYYDPKVAGYLDRLLSPPPERLSAERALEIAARSPHNVLHLMQGESAPGDTADQNRYTRALPSGWKPFLCTMNIETRVPSFEG